jgi:hypothetical protein
MLNILESAADSENENGRIVVVLERPYDFLKRQLESVLAGQSEMMIVVDRRYGERRRKKEFVSPERRNCDRRTTKGMIGSAIIAV